VGKAHLDKAVGFHTQQNWIQALRYAEIAATKLKQLKDRRLETVQLIDRAMICKFDALQRLGRHRKALECIQECYTLWAMNHLRNPGSMKAALMLIQSCIHNHEYEDAENYARHAYFMIAEMTDNFIPSDGYPKFLADVSYYLAQAIYRWAEAGGIPPEQKQKAGEEAIEHARKALELNSQLHGTESSKVAMGMSAIADVLDFFNDIDDDESLRLCEQAGAITRRVEGSSSTNVARWRIIGVVRITREPGL
jgi:tetratricopeptide (TPR) repeat protein